jgi:hypothetical protein
MESTTVVKALAALAQASRLELFRALVVAIVNNSRGWYERGAAVQRSLKTANTGNTVKGT